MPDFFISSWGISRRVIQHDIQYYCGPGAIVRPYIHHGCDGFLITTDGPNLTAAQIEDLRAASRRYEEQQAALNINQPEDQQFLNRSVPLRR